MRDGTNTQRLVALQTNQAPPRCAIEAEGVEGGVLNADVGQWAVVGGVAAGCEAAQRLRGAASDATRSGGFVATARRSHLTGVVDLSQQRVAATSPAAAAGGPAGTAGRLRLASAASLVGVRWSGAGYTGSNPMKLLK